jgi:hypothetical protein
MKQCRVCKAEFEPRTSTHRVCSMQCAVALNKQNRERAYKAETKALKRQIKPRSAWIKEAQAAFNRFIRTRDAGKPCISCGRNTKANTDAGHYRSTGAQPALRFNELNCHLQCRHCNSFKSGALSEYRIGLIAKIGPELVEWLDRDHPPAKFSIDDLKFLKAYYTEQTKRILKYGEGECTQTAHR